ncbi:tetratricopeptide repeat protein [Taibaiella soli]|uniref:Tetratricopeptide repeat protein n=1 Tax=Taibaiella soli TaxID=1649169 RepID=A0A2W2A8W3_9BACT|nr:tetratricopeptide repeat protein [Taibaiella soli]PZF71755.1 hypothetical protein DN068_16955 [Taibaiella soli]
MKKVLLVAAGLSMSFMGLAQKKNVTTAIQAMGQGDLDEAQKAIDAAVLDESTKNDEKAWMTRGDVYLKLMEAGKVPQDKAIQEAANSYMKVVQIKPDYKTADMDTRLLNIASSYYNTGITAYNNKQYPEAYNALELPVKIHDLDGGKRFAANKSFDTVATEANRVRAYSAFYDNKYDDAAIILNKLKDNPITEEPNNYLMLAEIYSKQNNNAALIKAIEEGRKKYPNDANLRNQELNIYIKSGKTDELIKKLEDAVAAEKDDKVKAELYFNLGNTYNNMAFPKDAAGKDMAKPANYTDMVAKAIAAYQNAIKLEPTKAEYQYNAGAVYFNQATEVNNKMNAITGNTAADNKKFDDLKKQRDGYFTQALPYLEQTYNLLDAKASSLSQDDKYTYQASMMALREIYSRTSQLDKAKAMKAKMDAAK